MFTWGRNNSIYRFRSTVQWKDLFNGIFDGSWMHLFQYGRDEIDFIHNTDSSMRNEVHQKYQKCLFPFFWTKIHYTITFVTLTIKFCKKGLRFKNVKNQSNSHGLSIISIIFNFIFKLLNFHFCCRIIKFCTISRIIVESSKADIKQ